MMQLNRVERDLRARFLLRALPQPARLVRRSLGEVGRSGSTFQYPLIVTRLIVQRHHYASALALFFKILRQLSFKDLNAGQA